MKITGWVLLLLLLAALIGDGGRTRAMKNSCPGERWKGQISNEEPRLVHQVRNGERYEVGVGEADDVLRILHLYGSPYELGYAHGELLHEEIQSMYLRLFRQVEDDWIISLHLTLLPDWIARIIARLALNAALDTAYLLTLKFLPPRFVDEMLGLSQGADVDFQDVARIHMIPELFQTSCSMLGSWGPATISSSYPERGLSLEGGLYQMRALDWDMTGPVLDYPTVIFFHPSDGNSLATFSWAGFIGALSGYSGHLGVSEKVWLGYNGTSAHRGMPWYFVLRDILQFTSDLEGAWNWLTDVERTCPILIGIGSLKDQKFVLVGYSPDTLELHDDSNFTMITSTTPGGNELPGVIYVDKYQQPSDDMCMGSMVSRNYGKLDERVLMEMASRHRTGDMHTAVYDFAKNNVYFSWALTSPNSGDMIPAYSRNFVKLNMSSLFSPGPGCDVPGDSGKEYERCQRAAKAGAV